MTWGPIIWWRLLLRAPRQLVWTARLLGALMCWTHCREKLPSTASQRRPSHAPLLGRWLQMAPSLPIPKTAPATPEPVAMPRFRAKQRTIPGVAEDSRGPLQIPPAAEPQPVCPTESGRAVDGLTSRLSPLPIPGNCHREGWRMSRPQAPAMEPHVGDLALLRQDDYERFFSHRFRTSHFWKQPVSAADVLNVRRLSQCRDHSLGRETRAGWHAEASGLRAVPPDNH